MLRTTTFKAFLVFLAAFVLPFSMGGHWLCLCGMRCISDQRFIQPATELCCQTSTPQIKEQCQNLQATAILGCHDCCKFVLDTEIQWNRNSDGSDSEPDSAILLTYGSLLLPPPSKPIIPVASTSSVPALRLVPTLSPRAPPCLSEWSFNA